MSSGPPPSFPTLNRFYSRPVVRKRKRAPAVDSTNLPFMVGLANTNPEDASTVIPMNIDPMYTAARRFHPGALAQGINPSQRVRLPLPNQTFSRFHELFCTAPSPPKEHMDHHTRRGRQGCRSLGHFPMISPAYRRYTCLYALDINLWANHHRG